MNIKYPSTQIASRINPSVINKLIFFLLLLAVQPGSAALLDGVAAAVDEEIILESDVSEEIINAAREMGQSLPNDPKEMKALREQTLQMLIDRKVMLAKAAEEKIVVSDTDVEDELRKNMSAMEERYGSKEAMETYLATQGATYRALENNMRRRLKEKRKIKELIEKQLGSRIRVTEDQIVDFYKNNRDQLELPDMVSLSEVVVSKKPSTATEQVVVRRLEEIKRKADMGSNFEDLVHKESEAADAAQGGIVDLTKGTIQDEAFEKAVFALKASETSQPLRTASGFELVKMMELRGDKAKIRHILLTVKPTDADIEMARVKATQARDRLRSGEEFAKVAAELSDDAEAKATGGKVEEVELSKLKQALPAVATALERLSPDEISDVIEDLNAFFIIRLDRRAKGRELTLDEARSHIQNYLKSVELEKVSQSWITQLRSKYYIRVF